MLEVILFSLLPQPIMDQAMLLALWLQTCCLLAIVMFRTMVLERMFRELEHGLLEP